MTIGAQTAILSRGNERLCFASNSSFRSGEPFQFMNRPQCLAEAQNLRLTKEAPAYVVSCYYAVVAPGGIIGHGKPEATTLRTLFSKLAGFLLKSFSLIFSNMAYEPSTSRFLYERRTEEAVRVPSGNDCGGVWLTMLSLQSLIAGVSR